MLCWVGGGVIQPIGSRQQHPPPVTRGGMCLIMLGCCALDKVCVVAWWCCAGFNEPVVVLLRSASGDEEVSAAGSNLKGVMLTQDLPHLSHLGKQRTWGEGGVLWEECGGGVLRKIHCCWIAPEDSLLSEGTPPPTISASAGHSGDPAAQRAKARAGVLV
jgi:hypothetical protein